MLALKSNRQPAFDAALGNRSRRPRILFVGEAVSLAHVGRPAVLARWARAAGYDVRFACGAAFAGMVRQEGFTPRPLPTIPPEAFYGRLRQGQFFYTADELGAYVRAEVDLLKEMQPDLVVGDFRLSLAVSTAMTRTPLVSLCNAYWSPTFPFRFLPPRAGLFRYLPSALGAAFFAAVRPLAFRWFGRSLNQVRCRFGLAPLSDFRQHYTAGQWCAYLDAPELVPVPRVPPNHFFLGPVWWQPLGSVTLRDGGRRIAYVSMGSSGDDSVLPAVLQALLALGLSPVVSGVDDDRAARLRDSLPDGRERCQFTGLIDPRQVLERAGVTVCHGGNGTVYQSLACGVPVLCLPSNPDQQLMSQAIGRAGAGRSLAPRRATPQRLRQALTALLDEQGPVQTARQLAQTIGCRDVRHRWLGFLETAIPGCHEPESAPMTSTLRGSGREATTGLVSLEAELF